MSRLLKSRGYFMKSLGFVLLFGFISLGAVGGCNNNSGGQGGTQALTENDFVDDPSLSANPKKGVIVDFLESPDSGEPEKDTGTVGVDEVPLTYRQTLEQTICWEDDDGEAMHFMELLDSEGAEVLRVDVNGECVTEVIEAGDYVMRFHHDGGTETTLPVFIIPNLEDTEQAREADGLINRFKVAVANILDGIQNTVYKDARAQTVQDKINTLIKTNSCPGCNLSGANLFAVDLIGANLSRANLSVANLFGADLRKANLRGAVLNGTVLTQANLNGANLSGADLIGANLSFAGLIGADLRGADLRKAFMLATALRGADLRGADLRGADLRGANLSEATWCDGCICANFSEGTCDGCASVDICTGDNI